MRVVRWCLNTLLLAVICQATQAHADRITVAAAADLRFAMDALVATFKRQSPADDVSVVYGSSGMFLTQIEQGAPFDLYFSADISYPQKLIGEKLAVGPVRPYARGRLVLWSTSLPHRALSLRLLGEDRVKRIAIADPAHAPYGMRAQEALRQAGLWDKVQGKLLYGHNIAQAAQYVETGNADVGLVALSLVMGPGKRSNGAYILIPESMHQVLDQGFVVTSKGANKPLARRFADHVMSPMSRAVMASYGFAMPHPN
jgi:molybdate transport system substrate-binding protein